jgi:hypothetical protein
MKDSRKAYEYAFNVIKGRWIEAESYIIRDPKWAYFYALNVIKSRWPEAELYVMKNPQYAYYYARDIIKSQWLEAEPYIIVSEEYGKYYFNLKSTNKKELIESNPEWIKYYDNQNFNLQNLAINLGGRKIALLIKNPHPEIIKKYPEIFGMRKSGLL